MTQFIAIEVDPEVNVGYVRYRRLPEGERARSRRVNEDIVADYRENGELLGIELLALDDEAMKQGREFAAHEAVAFPRDIQGAPGMTDRRAYLTAKKRESRQRARDDGRCIICTARPADPGRVTCTACRKG